MKYRLVFDSKILNISSKEGWTENIAEM